MDPPNRTLTSPDLPLRPRSQPFRAAAGYLIAAACLVWVFHDVRWSELFRDVRGMNWWWVAAAVGFDILSYVCQGFRWQLLLLATGRISVWRTTQAIYAGLFINEILPLRIGEIVRTCLVSQWLSTGLAAVVPSILAERFFDAVWLALAMGVTAVLLPLPGYLLQAANVLGAGVLVAVGVFVYAAVRGREAALEGIPGTATPGGLHERATHLLKRLSSGLHQIGRSRYFYASFGVSALVLVFQILAFWLVMLAYGLKAPVWAGAVTLLIVHVGTALPGAPSNIGTYQFFCVVGLTLFGVDKTVATGFSVVVFLLLTVPLWAIGSIAFGRAGLTVRQVTREFRPVSGRERAQDLGAPK